jgi:TRAP transporter TAXI family solute receptor
MNKLFLMAIVVVALLTSLIMSDFAQPAPAAKTTPEKQWPSHISFVGGPAGSGAFIRTSGLVVLMSKYLNTSASAELVGAPAAQLSTLRAGKAEMAWPHMFAARQAYFGDPVWKGDPVDVRTVIAGPGSAFIIVADGGSGIKTFEDLRGKKVQVIQAAAGTQWMEVAFYYLLEAYGMTKNDLRLLNWTSFEDMMNAIDSGTADAGVSGTSPATLSPAYKERDTRRPLRWVHTSPDKLKYVVEKMGSQVKIENFPGGQLRLHPNPEPTLIQYQAVVARPDVPESFIYSFLKMVFDEHHDEYLALKGGIEVYNIPATIESAGSLPLHSGVVRYLKEKGLWNSQLEAQQGKLVSEFGRMRKK